VVDAKCSKFYECIREAYELAEAIADRLALIVAAMDYGDGSDSEFLLATYITLQQVVTDIYDLVQRIKQATRIMRGDYIGQEDL
jgi:hypothetical protein